jgi:hypothetical protein
LFKKQNFHAAIEHYSKYLACDSSFFVEDNVGYHQRMATLLINRALCYQKISNFEQSLKDGIEAFEKDPTNPKSLYVIGKSYEQLGDLEKSAQAFSNVLVVEPQSKEAQSSLDRVKKQIAALSPPLPAPNVPKGRKVAPVVFGNVAPLEENTAEAVIEPKSRARAASEISDMIYPSPTVSPRLHPVVNVAIASINEYSRSNLSANETQDIQERVGLHIETSLDEGLLPKHLGMPPFSKQLADLASILHQDYLTWKSVMQLPRYGYLLSYQWWHNWLMTAIQKDPVSPAPFPSLSYDEKQEFICLSPRRETVESGQSFKKIGLIDNSSLASQLSNTSLRGLDGLSCLRYVSENLTMRPLDEQVPSYDFIFIPTQAWLALQHWYGGGAPELFVKVDPLPRSLLAKDTFGILELTSNHLTLTSVNEMETEIQAHSTTNTATTALATTTSTPSTHFCNVCHDVGNLRCSKCKRIYYCSQGCQGSDWQFHKLKCQKLAGTSPSETSSTTDGRTSTTQPTTSSSSSNQSILSQFDWARKLTGLSQSHTTTATTNSSRRSQCRGLVGLANLGNSCYLNASIQCLAHTFPLVKYLISSRYHKDINTTSVDTTRGKFVNEFAQLVKEMWLKPYPPPSAVLQPIAFRRLLGRLNADYSTFQQQDAHDVLVYLLDRLHEDVNRVAKKPYVENSEGNGENDEHISQESWDKHKLREDSCIQEIIGCQLRSQLICPADNCHKKSVSFEFASTIQLAIPNRNRDRTRSNSAGLFQYKDSTAARSSSLKIPIIYIPEVTLPPLPSSSPLSFPPPLSFSQIPTKIRGTSEPFGLSILSEFITFPLQVTIEEDSLAFVNTLRDTLQKRLYQSIHRFIAKRAIENGETPPPAITGQRRIFEKGELILIELEEAPEGPYSESSQPCGLTLSDLSLLVTDPFSLRLDHC